jgi:hypothetical protein
MRPASVHLLSLQTRSLPAFMPGVNQTRRSSPLFLTSPVFVHHMYPRTQLLSILSPLALLLVLQPSTASPLRLLVVPLHLSRKSVWSRQLLRPHVLLSPGLLTRLLSRRLDSAQLRVLPQPPCTSFISLPPLLSGVILPTYHRHRS